jgi:hypothetical protein
MVMINAETNAFDLEFVRVRKPPHPIRPGEYDAIVQTCNVSSSDETLKWLLVTFKVNISECRSILVDRRFWMRHDDFEIARHGSIEFELLKRALGVKTINNKEELLGLKCKLLAIPTGQTMYNASRVIWDYVFADFPEPDFPPESVS